ncbi:hypothetical protein P7C73_g5743, partial [Tremellales sp. Uapishka_1]
MASASSASGLDIPHPQIPQIKISNPLRGKPLSIAAAHQFSTLPADPSSLRSSMQSFKVKPDRPVYKWLDQGYVGGQTGDEPGVDVRSQRDEKSYSHLKGETRVTVVDYASDSEEGHQNVKVEFEGGRLRTWLDSPPGQRPTDEDGKPVGVRWIHVEGLNWEVFKILAIEYGLHPLAVEDALRASNAPRSKLDFYKTHLYLQVLVQHLHLADEDSIAKVIDSQHNGCSVSSFEDVEGQEYRDHGILARFGSTSKNGARLKLPEGVEGVFEPSVTPTKLQRGKSVLKPIYSRLEDEQSLLRRSGDVSMLAQAILDVVADLAIEITQDFESEILKLESSVLVDPAVEIVRHLHILSSQLIRLRRSLSPLLHITYMIRDQDVQRAAAASVLGTTGRGLERHHSSSLVPPVSRSPSVAGTEGSTWMSNPNGSPSNAGFFSPLTKLYIGDVLDHLEIVTSSMDQFVATCDHLTDYVFNVLSFQTNASMERLSIVTVVFLPLTFIASYFGMASLSCSIPIFHPQ